MESLYGVLKVQEKVPEEKALRRRIIPDSSMVEHTAVNRGVVGSSPTRGVWPHGQAVKTSPFHGGNTGSIPVGVIYHSDNRSIVAKRMIKLCILFYYV